MPDVPQEWSPNCNVDSVYRPPRGIVLHTADGTYAGTIGWQQNPASKVSSYFVTSKLGAITETENLDSKAWTQGTGNADWIGIENEGHGELGEALTDPQLDAVARIYAWVVRTWPGVPVAPTDDPFGHGLCWHGAGASIGWGHPGCPGEVIKAQRPEICRRTLILLGHQPAHPNPPGMLEDPMFVPSPDGANGRPGSAQAILALGLVLLVNGARLVGDQPVDKSPNHWWAPAPASHGGPLPAGASLTGIMPTVHPKGHPQAGQPDGRGVVALYSFASGDLGTYESNWQ